MGLGSRGMRAGDSIGPSTVVRERCIGHAARLQIPQNVLSKGSDLGFASVHSQRTPRRYRQWWTNTMIIRALAQPTSGAERLRTL